MKIIERLDFNTLIITIFNIDYKSENYNKIKIV